MKKKKVEVIYPEGLQLKSHDFFFVSDPTVEVEVRSKDKELIADRCYQSSFYYSRSDKTAYIAFNDFKVEVKLLTDIPEDYYSVSFQEVALPSVTLLVLRVFEEWYEFKQACKLRYRNIEIEIKLKDKT